MDGMRMNGWRKWKREDWKACFVLVGGCVLLTISGFLGEVSRKNQKQEMCASSYDSGIFAERREEEYLPWEQIEFLGQLEEFIASVSLHEAALRLGREGQRMEEVWAGIQEGEGEEVLYICGGKLVSSLDGMGMAIRKDNTCFYGNFREGKPEGVCTAIVFLEELPGYRYSMGLWKDGQMEGLGITGKYSWKRKGSRQGLEEQTSGMFQGDYLEGWLTYEQIDREGQSCWWEIAAREGKTCLDSRWVFWPTLGEYRLLSEKENQAFFVLPQNLTEQVRWKNQVPWEPLCAH